MQTENLIDIDEFCASHKIKISFIKLLQKNGLIEITIIKEIGFIKTTKLLELEKVIHFFYELDINLEGIETITHLLLRINSLNSEITLLKNKLCFYETND